MKNYVLCALVVVAWCVPAAADDLYPPTYRGAPLSYMAQWHLFTTGDFAAGIDREVAQWVDDMDPATYVYGGFTTHLDFADEGVWALTPASGGGFHNLEMASSFVANVINWVDWKPEKLLRVQVTYNDVQSNGSPTITNVASYGPDSGTGPYNTTPLGRVDVGGTFFYEDFIIIPNPDWEQIEFDLPQGTIVEQIVIDTWSPEPATLALLAVGGLALLRRRRK